MDSAILRAITMHSHGSFLLWPIIMAINRACPYGGCDIGHGIIPSRLSLTVKLYNFEGNITIKVAHKCSLRTLPSELDKLYCQAFTGLFMDTHLKGYSSMHTRDGQAQKGLPMLYPGCESLAALTAQCESDYSPTKPFEYSQLLC